MEPIHVVATGGSPILQAGFAAVLARDASMKLVATIGDARQFLTEASNLTCDVLLLDTDVPHDDVAAIVPKLTEAGRCPHVVVLTNNEDIAEIHATLCLGIQGYGIRRFLRPEDVLVAIRTVSQGLSWACPRTIQILMDLVVRLDDGLANAWHRKLPISERELDVLRCVAAGLREQDIASTMCLSRNTVKTYLRRIRTKLGVATSAEAVQHCVALGLLKPAPASPYRNPGAAAPGSTPGFGPLLQPASMSPFPPAPRPVEGSTHLNTHLYHAAQNGSLLRRS